MILLLYKHQFQFNCSTFNSVSQ